MARKFIAIVYSYFCAVCLCHCYGYDGHNHDNGRRCPNCGKVTILGARHVCKSKAVRHTSTSSDGYVSRVEGRDILSEESVEKMQAALPPFEGETVLGIEICWEGYSDPRPCLKTKGQFGALLYHELRKPIYSFEQEKYEKAKRYYDKYVLSIPVLGSVKGREEITDEEARLKILPILSSIQNDRARAREAQKKEKQAIAQEKQKRASIFNTMKKFAGRNLGAERLDTDEFDKEVFGGEYVRFKPKQTSYWKEYECAYLTTPKKFRIYEISCKKKNATEEEFEGAKNALAKLFEAELVEADDGAFVLTGESEKGNVRTLVMSFEDKTIAVTLTDRAGQKLAENEGSVYLAAHEKAAREEGSVDAYGQMGSIFGVKLLSVKKDVVPIHGRRMFWSGLYSDGGSSLCDAGSFQFSPDKTFLTFDRYYADITPKSKKVYRIYAFAKYDSNVAEAARKAIEMKYGGVMAKDEFNNEQQVLSATRENHVRRILLMESYQYELGGRCLCLCLVDRDGVAIAAKESKEITEKADREREEANSIRASMAKEAL